MEKDLFEKTEVQSKDKSEYDYEGDMTMSQLKNIMMNAKRLYDKLKPDTNLPEWVQSKITLAQDYIQTTTNYIETELDEAKAAPAVHLIYSSGKNVWKARNKSGRIKYFGHEFKDSAIKHAGIHEDAVAAGSPANAVGGGNVAGVGVGPQGEPGVLRTKYKDKNKAEAPSPIMEPMQKRKSFTQFTKGK